jgi:hypothetical protein
MSRPTGTSHRASRRHTTSVDELAALRYDIQAFRHLIRSAFERGATSDDPVVLAAAQVMAERQSRLERLEAERRDEVDPRAA